MKNYVLATFSGSIIFRYDGDATPDYFLLSCSYVLGTYLIVSSLRNSWSLAGRKLLYDSKTAFTSRVQVDNKIPAPMSNLLYFYKEYYIKVERLIKITY